MNTVITMPSNCRPSNQENSELVIEAMTRFIPANMAYWRAYQAAYENGVRMIPMSLPRVRWMERPEVCPDVQPYLTGAAGRAIVGPDLGTTQR